MIFKIILLYFVNIILKLYSISVLIPLCVVLPIFNQENTNIKNVSLNESLRTYLTFKDKISLILNFCFSF